MHKLSFHEPFLIKDEYKHILAQQSTTPCVSIAFEFPIIFFRMSIVLAFNLTNWQYYYRKLKLQFIRI